MSIPNVSDSAIILRASVASEDYEISGDVAIAVRDRGVYEPADALLML